MRKPHLYRGVFILPADRNASGIRWSARMPNGDLLRAETLIDIKQFIRHTQQTKPHRAMRSAGR